MCGWFIDGEDQSSYTTYEMPQEPWQDSGRYGGRALVQWLHAKAPDGFKTAWIQDCSRWIQDSGIQRLPGFLTSYVILDMLLNFSAPDFPHP